jgi:spore coat protein U-like protein
MDRIWLPLRLVVAALLVAAPAQLLAVTPAVQAQADAIVLKPLTLIKKTDMDFGTLLPSAAAGTATVDPFSGAVTAAGGVTALTGATSRAVFLGAGSRNSPYQIRIPKNPITLTRVGGTETMTVSSWTLDGQSNRMVDANEAFQFGVGAKLTVAANQAPGTYTGTFDVTVHYP